MTSSFPRFLAGLILVAGGTLTGLTAFGISMARWALSTTTFAISASDRALLDDMVALTPFVGAFALVAVIVGIALLIEHPNADIAALAVAGSATAVGLAGLVAPDPGQRPVHRGPLRPGPRRPPDRRDLHRHLRRRGGGRRRGPRHGRPPSTDPVAGAAA